MRERPILFSGRLVRRLLADGKTQTRRVFREDPAMPVSWVGWPCTDARDMGRPERKCAEPAAHEFHLHFANGFNWHNAVCPYGVPGDRLWVRETCRVWALDEQRAEVEYKADEVRQWMPYTSPEAERELERWERLNHSDNDPDWRPSIFMPRFASRITLEITDVRLEWLQEITGPDILAEGVEMARLDSSAAEKFAAGWDQINGKRDGCSWESNPLVWALTFRRVA